MLRLKLKGRSCELGEEWANCSRRSRGRKGKTEGLGLWSSSPCDPEDRVMPLCYLLGESQCLVGSPGSAPECHVQKL